MSRTLAEVSEKTGKSQVALRKMIERGQLAAEKESGRLVISDEAFEALLGASVLEDAADEIRLGNTHEVGNIFARLPNRIAAAILEGMPSQKNKTGTPQPYLKATEGVRRVKQPPFDPDDPHMGFPVGHRHTHAPRWKRSSKSTWSLDGASWTWNGFMWEGSGERTGMQLGDGISPAHPDSTLRPLPPSPSVAKK